MAPPTWAKWAIGPIEYDVNPKNKSPSMRTGTRNFAFTGIGGKSNISRASGNKNANATKTPYKAPDAPTITPLNAERAELRFSLPTLFIYENDKSPDIKKLSISLFVKPSPVNIE